MRRTLVAKLQDSLPLLGRDLVFADIASELISKNILVLCEYQTVLTASTDSGKAAILVEILAGKEDAAFNKFIDILRVDHAWIADEVLGSNGVGDVTDSASIERNSGVENLTNHYLELSRPVGAKRELSPSNDPPVVNKRTQCHMSRVSGANHTQATGVARTTPLSIPSVVQTIHRGLPSALQDDPIGCSTPVATQRDLINVVPDVPDNKAFQYSKDSEQKNQKLAQAVTDEMMNVLRKNHRACRDWTSLAHALGLSRLVHKIRVKTLVFGEDFDICVVYLLQEWVGEQPKTATVLNLLRALRTEGFNDVADELVEKFCT